MQPQIEPHNWLHEKVEEYNNKESEHIEFPMKDDNTEFNIFELKDDQKLIMSVILSKLKEWVSCDDLSKFKPLRMIVNGAGGSGKSVLVNTLVTVMRKMFHCNDVVKVVAPTGTAAFNVRGETFHHMMEMGVSDIDYVPHSMSQDKKSKLYNKFKNLIALICDERSLLTSKLLGNVEQQLSETLYQGTMKDSSWGNLPILILVGDDYQLPGVTEGALKALTSRTTQKMTAQGRAAILECSKFVMTLGDSKRLQENQKNARALISRVRLGEDLPDHDVNKLLSLHLKHIRDTIPGGDETVEAIERKAIHLVYTNHKRVRINNTKIAKYSSMDNPVAVCKSKSSGTCQGKAIAYHFDSKQKVPPSSMLCRGARVALEGRNYNPIWGLHNGACGIVEEIVFKPNNNPNHGDLPTHVIVNFPQYIGPIWDKDSPKVNVFFFISTNMTLIY